jgi:TolB-like protein
MNLEKHTNVLTRIIMAGLLLLVCTAATYAQAGGKIGKIAILPFTGEASADEQNGMPEWIGHTNEITRNFDVIYRTDIAKEAQYEKIFQHESGMIDSKNAVDIGNDAGAQYVLTGSITSLGSQRLLIVSIINLHDIRQVAGLYIKYNSIDEVIKDSSILNNLAADLVKMVRNQKNNLPPLAVLRVRLEGGAKEAEGDAMAQILAIQLLQEGKWAVCPRVTQEQVQSEYETQLKGGTTRASEQVRAGEAMVPQHVLAVVSRVIGTTNTFIADITAIEDGLYYDGSTEVYTSLSDGMNVMGLLAKKLSGGGSDQIQAARERAVKTDKFLQNAALTFSGWAGMGVGGTAGREGKTETDEVTGEEKPASDTVPFEWGINIEMRYRFFGIQTGANVLNDEAVYKLEGKEQSAEVFFVQIPILARLHLESRGAGIGLAPYAGIGLNPAVLKTDAGSAVPGSLSFIAGTEIVWLGESFIFSMGYQYNGVITNNGSFTIDGTSYDYKCSLHMLHLGLKYYLPLQKGD